MNTALTEGEKCWNEALELVKDTALHFHSSELLYNFIPWRLTANGRGRNQSSEDAADKDEAQ